MNEKVRELEERLPLAAGNEERVDVQIRLSEELRFVDPERAKMFAGEAFSTAKTAGYKYGEARSAHMLGAICELQAEYDLALEHFRYAQEIFKGLNEISTESILTTNQIAKVYANLGDYSKGLEFLYESLRVSDENKNRLAEANTLNSMSVFHQRLGNSQMAEECAQRCLDLGRELNDKRMQGIACVNLGNAHGMVKNWNKAREHWEMALEVFTAMGHEELQSSTLGNLGIACQNLGEFEKAEQYLLQCLAIKERSSNRYDIVRSLQNLASVNCAMKRFDEALDYCRRAFAMDEKLNVRSITFLLWKEMAMIHKGRGDHEKALECFEKYHSLEKELFTEEMRLKTESLQTRFEMEKKEKEKEIYRLRNIDLVSANEQITKQKEEIESSIRYARRIQEALLPDENNLKQSFAGAFMLYIPRDIVSGDFYWSAQVENFNYVAVADCTGHGVPGALMSVMGAAFLSEIIKERGVTDPGDVLNLLRLKVITALQSSEAEETEIGKKLQDGMDMVFCRYEPATKMLCFACANNPFWLLREGALLEFPADKFPVGPHHGKLQYFRSQQVELEPGDQFFLFTDGFADQFGGEKGKKLGNRRFRELLAEAGALSSKEQHVFLAQKFEEWKGGQPQTDDVCVIGFRV